ncbi:5'-nucleotidase C-terminal domain-containing protein [Paenibacillus sp. Marseille-Q4541]|uniref:5'-nucleotidase C-terminal domain-containing protein n=1 Tax=Paenibacillus sp. Marseille-Q4541 TaxID=2831522 RepID=UPI001BA63FAA|nr:5'-nucleotidase C-terminal domain-containing protein [Paenibacillus sp. Marseille-Q4541]
MRSLHKQKRRISLLLAVVLLISTLLPVSLISTANAAVNNDQVVISQVYGGGGNNGATYTNDFIELYNPTSQPINLTGWKIRYASKAGNFSDSSSTTLTGNIAPHSYFLIEQAKGTGGTVALPKPDQSGTLAMGAAEGKVELVNAASASVDIVGYGQATNVEGTPTDVLSSSAAAIRKALPGGPTDNRGLDTNNNKDDFTVTSPDPRNSSYVHPASDVLGQVTASPAPNAWQPGTQISLNPPTASASVYADVYGADGEGTGYKLVTEPLTLNEPIRIDTYAAQEGLADGPKTSFQYDVLNQTTVADARTAAKSDNVWTEGIITHIEGRETYIQDETAGIVLYDYPLDAEPGDQVNVAGVMEIYNNLQELKPHELLSSQVVNRGVGVPSPLSITGADLSTVNGETYEARLVSLDNVEIVSGTKPQFTAKQGGEQFTIYSNLAGLQAGKTYSRIIGVVKQFANNYQLIPLNEASLIEELFSVQASPASGPIIRGSSVTLSSPTENTDIYYTLDGSDPTTSSTRYNAQIQINEDVTLKAIVVQGSETSRIYEFTYTAVDQPRISDIQGESHKSSFDGQNVKDIEGVVTQYGYSFSNGSIRGFYIQDPEPDNNDNTSDAIYVYSTSANRPAIGDLVSVTGKVAEYNEGSTSNLTTTQIELQSYTKLAEDQELPAPIILGKNGRAIPNAIIDNDELAVFDPQEDAIDFYESLEGMRVQLENPTIISPYWASAGTYNIATRVENNTADAITPAGGLVLKEAYNYNPQRLIIAYSNPGQEVKTGDTFASDVTGVIGYNNSNFKVIPAQGELPAIIKGSYEQEVTTIETDPNKLRVASYNIENFYPGVGAEKINKLATSFVENMKSPDIISLVEVQDNNGEQNDGTTDAIQSYQTLINAIKNVGGPTYEYTDIAPVNNADGGAPGANIRVGYLYNPERVTLSASVNAKKGTSTEAVSYHAETDQLSVNPGRVDPTNVNFNASRKPLVAQFEFRGEKVIMIANHFNSKSGDQAPFGAVQPPTLTSEVQRHEIAKIVNNFVKGIVTENPDANIIVTGDLNDFQFTPTGTILKGNELDNLIDTLPLGEQYTYTYDGNSQVLDHILVSKNLTASSVVDVVHLNADFSPTSGRVSDHDPVVAQINLGSEPPSEEDFEMTILHTNDTHANLDTTNAPDTIARRVAAIKTAKEEAVNPILVDAGDVFSGTLYFNKYLGQADLEFMNLVKYDAMTFGNHEFDKGSEVLDAFINNAKFPFISSNVNFSADPLLNSRFNNEVTTQPEDGQIYPAVIMEVDGEQVGIIGVTTEDTANIASPGAVTFDNAIQKAKGAVAMLENEGVNKILLLSHLGYDQDVQLAKEVEGIDVIVGGHSHTKLDNAIVDRTNEAPKLIVQTGEKGQFLGNLNVVFDDQGVLKDWNDNLISIEAKNANGSYVITPDEEALSILNTKYKPGVTALKEEKVGTTEVQLDGVRDNVRTKETNLGNFIADGMLDAAKAAGTGAVIALQNGGGIRAPIEAGDVTMGDVMTVLPFNNDLVTITLTGQEIKDAMENGVSKIPSADGRFPHIAGMKFYYDSTKPVNERVLQIKVKGTNGYEPLDLNKSYEVATNAFTAKGGDFYASLEKAYKEGRVNLLYLPDFEVFSNYVKKIGNITAETSAVEGRIIDLKGAPLPEEEVTPEPGTPETGGGEGSVTPPTVTPDPVPTPGEILLSVTAENGAANAVVSEAAMKEALKQPNAGRITIRVTSNQPMTQADIQLQNQALSALIAATNVQVVSVVTPYGSYELPTSELKLSDWAKKLGAEASNILLHLSLSKDAAALSAASDKGYNVLGAVNFSITAGIDQRKQLSVTGFDRYVKHTLTIDKKASGSVAVVRVNASGTYTPVPFRMNGDQVYIYSHHGGTYLVLENKVTFGDINNHFAKLDVESLAAKMIIQGRSAQNYVPNSSVTRAEYVALLVRTLGLEPETGTTGFTDVQSADWFAGQVASAVKAGLISGYTDGSFRPDQRITREEIALMTFKALTYAGYDANNNSTISFKDAAQIGTWAEEAVKELARLGILKGDQNQRFAPKANATRGEVAAILNRMLPSFNFTK